MSALEELHTAVGQAADLLGRAPELAQSPEGREAREILVLALDSFAKAERSCLEQQAAPAGLTNDKLLAGVRVLSPLLFQHGLEPMPRDGEKTRQRMADEVNLVRRILEAAQGPR
ncbi:MAG: hypothetical protein IT506_11065 [Aquabacterium sp.]|nr:hypothetical protein [Aquabacterium sp.]